MKKQHEHKIDELFDRAFDDFKVEPSELVWENITKQIPHANNFVKPSHKLFLNKYAYIFYIAASIFAIIFVVRLNYFKSSKNFDNKEQKNITIPENKINDINNANSKSYNSVAYENKTVENPADTNNKTVAQIQENPKYNTLSKSDFTQKTVNDKKHTKHIIKESNTIKTQKYISKENITAEKLISNTADNAEQYLNNTTPLTANNINNYNNGNNNSVSTNTNTETKDELQDKIESISKIKSLKVENIPFNNKPVINSAIASTPEQPSSKQHFRPRIYLGVHYTPEWIFNLPATPIKTKEKKFNQNVQISLNYDYKNIMIQSGIGLSLYKNETSSNVNFISNDCVGQYYDVISYTYDSLTQTPIFNTSIVNVYDSINHSLYQSTKNNYRYIQIPFVIGYRKYIKQFSFTVRGGVGIGILNYKKETPIIFDKDNATVLNIERYTPALTETYWQFLFSMGCGYQINDKVFITAEPVFKYYLSPFYDNKEVKIYPYSIGLKTGLYYRF